MGARWRGLLDSLVEQFNFSRIIRLMIRAEKIMLPDFWQRISRAVAPREVRLRLAINQAPVQAADALGRKH